MLILDSEEELKLTCKQKTSREMYTKQAVCYRRSCYRLFYYKHLVKTYPVSPLQIYSNPLPFPPHVSAKTVGPK